VIGATVPVEAVDAIATGDEYRVAGRTVGTVRSVTAYPSQDDATRRLRVGVSFATRTADGRTTFGGAPLTVGRSVDVALDSYALNGTLIHKGGAVMPGGRTRTTVVVKQGNVSPEVASATAVGMTEEARDGTRARIVDKRVEPATVVLTSDDGDIHRREHPRNRDVYLTVELRTRTTDAGTDFHGRPLRTGSDVLLDFERVRVDGTVVAFEDEAASGDGSGSA